MDKGVSCAETMTQVHTDNPRTQNEDPCKTHPPGVMESSSVKKHEDSESKPEVEKIDLEERGKVSSFFKKKKIDNFIYLYF